MASRRQVEKRAEELECEYEYDGDVEKLDAPEGMVFATSLPHWRDIYNYPPGAWNAEEIYKELLKEMSMEITECRDPDCDVCLEIREESR